MNILNSFNAAVLTSLALLVFLCAIETGFRLGLRRRKGSDDTLRSHLGALQGALLGLLALLLGFTFAMAVSRFDARKELVLAESNAIGTTWLRARLVTMPERQKLTGLLREYVDSRLEFYDAGVDPVRLKAATETTEALQQELWNVAAELAAQDPHSVQLGLLIQSLNDVIDLHEKRLRALDNHVPDIVLYLVFVVAVMALGLIGYGSGLGGRRQFGSTALIAILVSLVLAVILDLDRPRRGLIKVSQDSIIKLKESFERPGQ